MKRLLLWWALLLVPTGLGACDDTLLALLTSSDPQSEFSQSIRQFNRDITSLGTALNNRSETDYSPLMQKLMTSWMNFSNKYNVNPPELARNDPRWTAKMAEAAQRIGQLGLLVEKRDYPAAHQSCLDLNGYLGRFFEMVGVSPLKRKFLQAADLFNCLDKACAANDPVALKKGVADLDLYLPTFAPQLATETLNSLARSQDALIELKTLIASSTPGEKLDERVQTKIDLARDLFNNFRARLLVNEWFPGLQSPEPK